MNGFNVNDNSVSG